MQCGGCVIGSPAPTENESIPSEAHDERIAIVGAGPAGLAAAWELVKAGRAPTVIDRNDRVGGLARTIWRDGYGFDLGPHRFFTKNAEVLDLWREFLGDDLLEVDRLTRIYYKGKFFSYPLKPLDALAKLGPVATTKAIASYVRQGFKKQVGEPENFEDWVVAQFGRTLFETFFKSYTEKVWGIPCDQIGKEWAGQRIKGLNLSQAIRNAFQQNRSDNVRSLVERFYYPRLGAGQLYERMAERLVGAGTRIHLNSNISRIESHGDKVISLIADTDERFEANHYFISAPITAVAEALVPEPPIDVIEAARSLYYRSHITVNLALDVPSPFPDNWIYIHSPHLKMARVANYGSFSTDLLPSPRKGALTVEYFCFESDAIWSMPDAELVAFATDEMAKARLLPPEVVRDGFVVRERDSYPTYYLGHREHFDVLYDYLSRYSNLDLIGRAGMYRYNNQDHASLTGIYAARNHLGITDVDLFDVNPEDEYQEEIGPGHENR